MTVFVDIALIARRGRAPLFCLNCRMPHLPDARLLQAALKQLNAGDIGAAAASCRALLRAAPHDPAVLQLHATIALRAGQPLQALESIRRGLMARPSHVPSLLLARQAARAAGVPDRIVPLLRNAIDHAPRLAEPAFLLCHTLLELNDPTLGAALAEVASRHPDVAPEWQRIGLVLHRAGKPAEALAAFTRAADADPLLAGAQFGRGLLLREAGRMADARTALRRAVTLEPENSGAWFALGLTCQDMEDDREAAAAFQAALRERPDFMEAAVNLGIVRQRLGDMDAAMHAYRSAIAIRPDSLGRIAQAVTADRTGMLYLDIGALRQRLGA